MGQLSTGLDAVQFYNKGIDVMRKVIAVTSKAKEDEVLEHLISATLGSLNVYVLLINFRSYYAVVVFSL